jgi:hypothetical protein
VNTFKVQKETRGEANEEQKEQTFSTSTNLQTHQQEKELLDNDLLNYM